MTLPIERTCAVLKTREFLTSLLDPKQTPKVPKIIRIRAGILLKHYPGEFDFDQLFSKEEISRIFAPYKKNEFK
jgi:hypothetical protein